MAGIIPIPTSRVSGLLTRQRLTQQYQTDQLDLFRLQEQISTGYRISTPSEDAPAAIRAISLQRLLSRKDQLDTNIRIGLQFLGATDNAISGITDALNQIKAGTLGVVGTVTTQGDRDGAISQINGALEQLVGLANGKAQGRYLFGGSQTNQPPYSFDDAGNVVYRGDDRSVQSYSDLGVLFASNSSGQEVFGGVSESVQGSADLDPQLSADTLLSSLRGGRGINRNGSLQIANTVSNEVSIVDISNASTVGDLIRLIEDNPPTGSTIDVSISDNGLTLVELGGDSLVVSEVGTGTTARELGLPTVPSTILVGEDLNPRILKTTRLEDLLGTQARASLKAGGGNNDVLIQGSTNGELYDSVVVSFVDGGGVPLDVDFNSGAKTLVITIDEGVTTAQDVVDAINAEGSFTAALDLVDSSSVAAAGTGFVSSLTTATTSGGVGETLDQTSGLRVVNGGEIFDITFEGAETVEDLLNILNSAEAGLLAEINAAGDGINIRSRLSGQDFQIGELNDGNTASQLGVRTFTDKTKLSDLNYGVGVPTFGGFDLPTGEGTDLTINSSLGPALGSFEIDLSDATSLSDIVTAINAVTTTSITAQLTADGTALELVDTAGGTFDLTVQRSPAAQYLGLVPADQTEASTATGTLTGNDSNYIDFTITASDGQSFGVDLSAATTVEDVFAAINTATGGVVVAQLADSGNGIELVDAAGGSGSLTVTAAEGSQAAEFLGLVAKGETQNVSTSDRLTGTDRNFLETDSVFTTLIRLRDALEANDLPAIERAAARLGDDIKRVTFARADAGARVQGLQLTQQNLQDEVIQLRSALSEEIDVDLVQAISDLTARQISLEASLRATANILQLSLLNFI